MMEMKCYYAESFFAALQKLDATVRVRVYDTVMDFVKAGPSSGSKIHQLEGNPDKRVNSIRVNKNYRIILYELTDQQEYLFCHVDTHDAAYEWAAQRKFEINQRTGCFQIFHVTEVADGDKPEPGSALFSPESFSDKTLMQIGVPEELLAVVRSIADDDQLMEAIEEFPAEVGERLVNLRTGTPLNKILEEIRENRQASGGDTMQNPDTLRSFVAPEISPEALTDLEQWRVFLHPGQRRLAQERFMGPALVLGGAGTGKTITALHRAKTLAARMIAEKADGKILYTFFNTSLANDAEDRLKKLCTAEELRRIEIKNIDRVLSQLSGCPGYERARVVYPRDPAYERLWQDAAAAGDPEKARTLAFYQEEWDRIVTEQDEISLDQYLKVRRTGRGKALQTAEREQVWKVFDAYQQLMRERMCFDSKAAMYCYRQAAADRPKPVYAHILVDEVQDFSAGALRLLRTLAGPEREDDIFLVGDTRQKLYGQPVSLNQCGIRILGRTQHLYVNYRTTEQLRRASVHILGDEQFDDLDGGVDYDPRYHSCLFGAPPQIRFCDTAESEMQWILTEIKKLTECGVQDQDICLTTYTQKAVKEYIKQLNRQGIKTYELKQNDARSIGGIRVGTMHRVKGLEFQFMFIAGINKGEFPPKAPALRKTAKCLLYVALTRAQKGAYISGYGKAPSEFLTALQEKAPSFKTGSSAGQKP